MRRAVIGIFLGSMFAPAAMAAGYFPPKDGWTHRTPAQEKLGPAKLQAAIDFAIASEMKYPPDLAKQADIHDLRISVPLKYAHEAFSSPIGPLKPHARPMA